MTVSAPNGCRIQQTKFSKAHNKALRPISNAPADFTCWNNLRSQARRAEIARPHHLWYARRVGRLVAWEFTQSFELSSSVLKEGGSQ
jgi:hypothetical protein